MSFQAMAWAVEQKLPAMQKIVLLMLANRTSHDDGLCYPSHEKLADDCGMDKSTVIRQIKKLEEAGLVKVFRTKKNGIKDVNKYKINIINSGREQLGVVAESNLKQSIEPVIEPVNLNTHTVPTESQKPATEKKARVCDVKNDVSEILDKEQQACLAWAMTQTFWANQVKNNTNQFLKLYHSCSVRSLRVQFEEYLQAKKNRDAATNNDHGSTNNLGSNYGTRAIKQPNPTRHFSDPEYYSGGLQPF